MCKTTKVLSIFAAKITKAMVDYIKLKQGLDIPIEGIPKARIIKSIISETVAVKPTDFKGVIPKLSVKEGDSVKAGSLLFTDKKRPEIRFTSPASGTVSEIVRGEKRKLLEIRIKASFQTEYVQFDLPKGDALTKEQVINALLESGLWVCIKQRPYGIIPSPETAPKAIFISGFNSAPLAADMDYTLREDFENVQAAIDALSRIAPGAIHFGLSVKTCMSTPFHKLNGVIFHKFEGPHPAGNVGIQIHHVCPVNKGDVIWTIDLHLLAIIGKLFTKGICDMTKTVAVGGPRVSDPGYVRCLSGMCMKDISDMVNDNVEKLQEGCPVRFVSGNVLTGTNVGAEGYLGFFDNQITVLTEGKYNETLGWAKIFRPKKFSFASTYFSWLTPKKKYRMDTNLNGDVRAFVMTSKYSKVLPMDIYPVYLLKAILADDIDKMEQLGIYEVIEEDFALCEYIDPSKIDIQAIISRGIDTMIKEMA